MIPASAMTYDAHQKQGIIRHVEVIIRTTLTNASNNNLFFELHLTLHEM